VQTLKASGERLAALACDLKERAAAKGTAANSSLDAQMADSLVDLGIISPVTKQNAGKQYQTQLARQLADFLLPLLRKRRGMMVLHDVYCVFNRCAPNKRGICGVSLWMTACTTCTVSSTGAHPTKEGNVGCHSG
jgi:hypothetical protein